jgi:EPS-associated MarR family transcriptional regulator
MQVKKSNSLKAPKGRSETALKPVRQAQQMTPNTQETNLKVLRHLENNPNVTQRQLAEDLGISLGKTNYCMKALVSKGMVKARNFKNSANKRAYLYILTPKGIETKAHISTRFLRRKVEEYEALRIEIEELRNELEAKEQTNS